MEPQIPVVLHRRTVGIVFFLAFFPGLIGIYGLGHVYLGKTRRGLTFLASAVIPFGLLTVSIVLPTVPWLTATIAWFTLWVFEWYDVTRVSKKNPVKMAGQEFTRNADRPTSGLS